MVSLSKIALPCFAAALIVGAVAPLAAQSLADSEWIPVEIEGTETVASGEAFVRFEQDSVFVGNGGCNSFRGRYVTNGDAILFGPAAATMMLCENDILAEETHFFQSLEKARVFVRDESELGLSDAEGNTIMRLALRNTE